LSLEGRFGQGDFRSEKWKEKGGEGTKKSPLGRQIKPENGQKETGRLGWQQRDREAFDERVNTVG